MKRLKLYIVIICIAALSSCNLVKDYKFDANPDGVRNEDMLAYFATSFDKSRTEYVKAMRLAGLDGAIAKGGITCVVPSNKAFAKLCSDYGVASVDALPASLLRSLMEYLIFPGQYRCMEMTEGVNVESVALDGNPIWIKRSSNSANRFLMLINDTPQKLSSLAYTVVQQDFLFRNGVVAQVVDEFPTFQPKVAQTQDGELLPDDTRTAQTLTLLCTDDTSIYNNDGTTRVTNYNAKPEGVAICQRIGTADKFPTSGTSRWGLFKFPLDALPFDVEDVVSAKLTTKVMSAAEYYTQGTTTQLSLYSCDIDPLWLETTASWYTTMYKGSTNSVREIISITSEVKSTAFTINGLNTGGWVTSIFTGDNAAYPQFDITTKMMDAYTDATKSNITFAINEGDYTNVSKGIRLCSKDGTLPAGVDNYTANIVVSGPIKSNMELKHNKAITLSNGVAVLTPASSFEFGAPSVSDGYNYLPENIIYMVKSLPANGYVTKYGLALGVNGKFTQAEMLAGVVKYVSKAGGSDSFELKVLDYLKGIYLYESQGEQLNYITVNIN